MNIRNKPWSDEDIELLKKLREEGELTNQQIADRLGRTKKAVGQKVCDLNLPVKVQGWSQERKDKLKHMIEVQQLSYKQAADKLGVSASAIAGQIDRLDIQVKRAPGITTKPRGNKNSWGFGRSVSKVKHLDIKTKPSDLKPQGPTSQPTPLVAVLGFQCKFPLWPDDSTGSPHYIVCGAPKEHLTEAYCNFHRRVAA